MLDRFTWLVDGLVVRPERMRRNLEASHGLFFSQRVLLALVESGLPRDDAYVARPAERDARLGGGAAVPRHRRRRPRDRRPRSTSTPSSTSTAYTRHVDIVFDRLHALVAERRAVHA